MNEKKLTDDGLKHMALALKNAEQMQSKIAAIYGTARLDPQKLKKQFSYLWQERMPSVNASAMELFKQLAETNRLMQGNQAYMSWFSKFAFPEVKFTSSISKILKQSEVLKQEFSDIDWAGSLQLKHYDLASWLDSRPPLNMIEEVKPAIAIYVSDTDRIKGLLRDVYRKRVDLHGIPPRDFEQMVAELLESHGFEVELTKQTKDNGYDILALKRMHGFGPVKYLVECKRYREDRKVGVEIIRSFKEVIVTEKANKGLIVTTSYFTLGALEKKKENPYLLDYKDKEDIIEWINTYFNPNQPSLRNADF